ncbi:UvrD-helicase domain-containing protein [Candidatus Gracilibacteria bacterium]|nr:UvrD-helicase domain-containing protein [Candidatus Gracilibacteria bacterium]
MSSIFDNLNDRQIEAVTHFTGPLLVIAGAGSGKTKALTNRIAYLIMEKGINPWNILAVTFTNKAAKEMKGRVMKLLGKKETPFTTGNFYEDDSIPTVGTFHSICVRILRKYIHLLGYENTFVIYDDTDQQILMKHILEEMMLDPKKMAPRAILGSISNAKNQLLGPKEFAGYAHDFFSEKVSEIYPRYQKALIKANALDFDDIIMKTVELFQTHPEVLEVYREKFKFISVDEYQDTNRAQYLLVKMLAEKYKNLCVIGDADQSIYSWRGATIQNILDFEKDYPDAKVVTLEQNYRSTQLILDASNQIIKKNERRKPKDLWTSREGGEKIKEFIADNERHEAELISREISELLIGSEYPVYNDFVVLYRTNAQSRVLEEVFMRQGLPYKIVGGIKFYSRKEVKDIIAYLRVIQNPSDNVNLLRILNTPARKIGPKTIEAIKDFSIVHDISFFNAMLLHEQIEDISDSKGEYLENFVKLITDLRDLNSKENASAMVRYVLDKTGYKKMIDDGTIEGESRLENIAELISVSHKYDNIEPATSLSVFLEEISLISDLDTVNDTDNAVTFMTVHSAKGLEFPFVFIAGLEEGIFPHNRSLMDREQLEEERRLMYVAMTRAKDRLYLLHARERMLYGESKANIPSQFLEDIDATLVDRNYGQNSSRKHFSISEIERRPVPVELDRGVDIELASGDRVAHLVFGSGIVVNVTGGVATVAFEDPKIGVKKLAISVAPLRKIS